MQSYDGSGRWWCAVAKPQQLVIRALSCTGEQNYSASFSFQAKLRIRMQPNAERMLTRRMFTRSRSRSSSGRQRCRWRNQVLRCTQTPWMMMLAYTSMSEKPTYDVLANHSRLDPTAKTLYWLAWVHPVYQLNSTGN